MGESFFFSLALHLAETLEADYAYVAELMTEDPKRAKTRALIADGKVIDNMEVDLTGTPCETVAGNKTCSYPANVQKLFPDAQVMAQLAVEAYIGAPLINSKGKHLGFMTVMYRKPLSNTVMIESTLQIFAARATAELERMKSDAMLKQTHSELEMRVQKRTEDLAKKNIDLTNEIKMRNKAEETLLESEQRFRAVAYCTADFIWEGHVRTNKMDWIGDIDSCLGYKKGEFPRTISGHMDNVHHEDKNKVLKAHEQALATGKDLHESYRIKCKDGSYRYWDARGKAIGFEGGKAITWVGSVTDFTNKVLLEEEAKLAQSRLIHANKMTSLGTIASGVAHEINNPNSYIMSNSQVLFKIWNDVEKLIQENYDKNNELILGGIPYTKLTHLAPKLILGISEGSIRIKQIIDNLRNFSRPVNVKLNEKVDINTAILTSTSMIDSYIQKHTNNFRINCDNSIPQIKGNSQQIEQVIINLTINALQSLKDKTGKVIISTSYDINKESIVILIIDDGTGIDADILNKIREPFFTTHQGIGGTGLGLSITSTIIKDHQGSIDFSSEAGEGTIVTVTLPV